MNERPTRKLTEVEKDNIADMYRRKSEFGILGFVTAAAPIPMGSKDEKGPWGGNPDRIIPVGQTLRIVMVSRFDDAGLTDDLKAVTGYSVRLNWEDAAITDIRLTPEPTK